MVGELDGDLDGTVALLWRFLLLKAYPIWSLLPIKVVISFPSKLSVANAVTVNLLNSKAEIKTSHLSIISRISSYESLKEIHFYDHVRFWELFLPSSWPLHGDPQYLFQFLLLNVAISINYQQLKITKPSFEISAERFPFKIKICKY
jgi:hypothetical protein